MDTDTLDKLYLEWSQFTKALTRRELVMIRALEKIVALSDLEMKDGDAAREIASRAIRAAVGNAGKP